MVVFLAESQYTHSMHNKTGRLGNGKVVCYRVKCTVVQGRSQLLRELPQSFTVLEHQVLQRGVGAAEVHVAHGWWNRKVHSKCLKMIQKPPPAST